MLLLLLPQACDVNMAIAKIASDRVEKQTGQKTKITAEDKLLQNGVDGNADTDFAALFCGVYRHSDSRLFAPVYNPQSGIMICPAGSLGVYVVMLCTATDKCFLGCTFLPSIYSGRSHVDKLFLSFCFLVSCRFVCLSVCFVPCLLPARKGLALSQSTSGFGAEINGVLQNSIVQHLDLKV